MKLLFIFIATGLLNISPVLAQKTSPSDMIWFLGMKSSSLNSLLEKASLEPLKLCVQIGKQLRDVSQSNSVIGQALQSANLNQDAESSKVTMIALELDNLMGSMENLCTGTTLNGTEVRSLQIKYLRGLYTAYSILVPNDVQRLVGNFGLAYFTTPEQTLIQTRLKDLKEISSVNSYNLE